MSKIRKVAVFLMFVFCSLMTFSSENLQLEKVVIFSRHGLRSPLTSPGSRLSKVTPYEWENWDVPASHLTKKGAILETYFGQYINDWLIQNEVIKKGECLSPDNAQIYTNSLQRTIATGQSLTTGIFPGCDIKTEHKMEIGKMDPVFNPVITTDNAKFKEEALKGMNLKKRNQELKGSYSLLSDVINYTKSEECLKEGKCKFFNEEGTLKIEKDKEPGVDGPIKLGTQIGDALLLQYYEGYPLDKIAGNNINTREKWQKITDIKNGYEDLLFATEKVAKNVAAPLIKYIYNDISSSNHKVTVLVGHDSNLVAMFAALGFKDYKLEEQVEKTPIGGKVFFEIWKDKKTGERKVKVEYIYQTLSQIRETQKLTRENPPKHTVLEMKNCKIDRGGYCPYSKFMAELKKFN